MTKLGRVVALQVTLISVAVAAGIYITNTIIEDFLITEALETMEDGKPRKLEFGVSDAMAWEVGLACGGEIEVFVEKLDVDEELAGILVQEGFTNVEEVAYVPESELLAIEEFDESIVAELRRRARDALLTQMIASEEQLEENRPAEDLLALEGMSETIAFRLAEQGIRTRDDLAECAVDELEDVKDLDPETAAKLIMEARAHWFAEEG